MPQFTGAIEQDWKVTSYSALCYGVANVHVLPGSTDEGVNTPVLETVTDEHWDRFSFPKGANAGSCLHQILEDVPFAHFATNQISEDDKTKVIESFKKYGIDEKWLSPVLQWLTHCG